MIICFQPGQAIPLISPIGPGKPGVRLAEERVRVALGRNENRILATLRLTVQSTTGVIRSA